MKFMWTKPDVAAKDKMWGILWTTGSWIVMSMTAKQGATGTKLEIYCNRKTSNWRNKEDNHLKIKKIWRSAHTSRICRDRTSLYFGKGWVTSNIFCLHSKLKRLGQLFVFFPLFCQYIITFASYNTKIRCNSLKGGKLKKWSQ